MGNFHAKYGYGEMVPCRADSGSCPYGAFGGLHVEASNKKEANLMVAKQLNDNKLPSYSRKNAGKAAFVNFVSARNGLNAVTGERKSHISGLINAGSEIFGGVNKLSYDTMKAGAKKIEDDRVNYAKIAKQLIR